MQILYNALFLNPPVLKRLIVFPLFISVSYPIVTLLYNITPDKSTIMSIKDFWVLSLVSSLLLISIILIVDTVIEFRKLTKLNSINISNAEYPYLYFVALAIRLSKKDLNELTLSALYFTDEDMSILSRIIKNNNIKTLNLDNCNISDKNIGFIMPAIINSSIKELNLSNNPITQVGQIYDLYTQAMSLDKIKLEHCLLDRNELCEYNKQLRLKSYKNNLLTLSS